MTGTSGEKNYFNNTLHVGHNLGKLLKKYVTDSTRLHSLSCRCLVAPRTTVYPYKDNRELKQR